MRRIAAAVASLMILASSEAFARQSCDPILDAPQPLTNWGNGYQGYPAGPPYPSMPFYSVEFPALTNEIGTYYSVQAVEQGTATYAPPGTAFYALKSACEQTPSSYRRRIKLLNATAGVENRVDTNSTDIQIIHGLVISNSFVSIVLPPGWNKDPLRPYDYPIIVNAQYDVNQNIFLGFGHFNDVINAIAESAKNGGQAAIGVIWNGGASETSVTGTAEALTQFRAIVDFVSYYAEGDRHRIVMVGESRGGYATLRLAADSDAPMPPAGQFSGKYTIVYAIAAAPGTRLGFSARVIGANLPGQLIGVTHVGDQNAWRPTWTHPVTGAQGWKALIQLLFGNPSCTFSDEYTCWFQADHINNAFVPGNLKTSPVDSINGLQYTQLILTAGSQDEWVPFASQMDYIQRLKSSAIKFEAYVVMRGGHSQFPVDAKPDTGEILAASEPLLRSRLAKAVVELSMGNLVPQAQRHIYVYAVDKASPKSVTFVREVTQAYRSDTPVSLDIPYRVYPGMEFTVVASGPPGALISMSHSLAPGQPFTFSIDANGIGLYGLSGLTTAALAGVQVEWTSITVTRGGVTQPLTIKSAGLLAPGTMTTTIESAMPPWDFSGLCAYRALSLPIQYKVAPFTLPSDNQCPTIPVAVGSHWQWTGWGLSEY